MTETELWIADADVGGRRVDVHVASGRIASIEPPSGPHRRRTGADVVHAGGGALLPGLHDHHIHLRALAAARLSIAAGPPSVTTADELIAVLRAADAAAPPDQWLRAVGYHESVAGDIDGSWLDRAVPGRPVRLQHRGGACWILNGAAATAVGLDQEHAPGLERDESGRATGRLFRLDDWLRARVPSTPTDLGATARSLSARGVTSVTDATPFERAADLGALAADLGECPPIEVVITGAPGLDRDAAPTLPRGPAKIVIADHALPAFDDLIAAYRTARRARRTVAVHCVTRAALLLALAAWDEVGAEPGDRIEHGAVVPLEVAPRIAELGLTVVTQPGFVRERGDQYLADVDRDDLGDLWRCRSLIDAGIAVGGSTDAPYGDADPWLAVAAATTRATAGGSILGKDERLDATAALGLFLAPLDRPGGPPRRVATGVAADLCLLDCPLADVLHQPSSEHVALTVRAGRRTFTR